MSFTYSDEVWEVYASPLKHSIESDGDISAKSQGCPVVYIERDWSRRLTIHQVSWPETDEPFITRSLSAAVEAVTGSRHQRAVVITRDSSDDWRVWLVTWAIKS